MPDLVIEHLVVEYDSGGFPIRPLDGFAATVDDGSLAVLLGPSGCGKTTLLSCLGGILTPTAGRISYGDTVLTELDESGRTTYRQSEVGIVFQAFNLVPSLTARENVMAPLLAAGVESAAATARADELLELVGISDRANHRPPALSGGQQQRVSLARSLVHDPKLIIADEPTASLDYIQVEGVLRLLREIAGPGRVVIVATHDDRLIPLADQIIEMVPEFRDDVQDEVTESLADGEVLFEQGSRGSRIYIVESGEIEILRETSSGHHQLLATLGAGEHFGEMGPLFGLARSATARAKGATTLTGYTRDRFREHVGVHRLTDLIREDPTR